jgi:hypothetical protein
MNVFESQTPMQPAVQELIVATDATGTWSRQLTLADRIVRATTTLGVGTLKMPDVREAKGMIFDITLVAGTNNLVLDDKNNESEDASAFTGLDMDAALDHVTVMSNGYRWTVLANDIA